MTRPAPPWVEVHATAVAIGRRAVLLRGPSGTGKSDLALRLMDGGARLVADDRCRIARAGDRLMVSAPPALSGLVEVRGVGIVALRPVARARLALVVDLVAPAAVERLPRTRSCRYHGLAVRLLRLAPFEASAPAKVRLALAAGRGAV